MIVKGEPLDDGDQDRLESLTRDHADSRAKNTLTPMTTQSRTVKPSLTPSEERASQDSRGTPRSSHPFDLTKSVRFAQGAVDEGYKVMNVVWLEPEGEFQTLKGHLFAGLRLESRERDRVAAGFRVRLPAFPVAVPHHERPLRHHGSSLPSSTSRRGNRTVVGP